MHKIITVLLTIVLLALGIWVLVATLQQDKLPAGLNNKRVVDLLTAHKNISLAIGGISVAFGILSVIGLVSGGATYKYLSGSLAAICLLLGISVLVATLLQDKLPSVLQKTPVEDFLMAHKNNSIILASVLTALGGISALGLLASRQSTPSSAFNFYE